MTERPTLTARGLARQQALMLEAAELFLSRGFAAVTVDEIVAAAGGSKTNVYKQFGGKEGLFIAVVERLSEEFLSPLEQLAPGPVDSGTALAALGRTLLHQLLAPRHIAFQRMIIASSDQFPQLMEHWYAVGPRRSQAIIARHLPGVDDAPRLAMLFHDMLVTEPVLRAMMGRPCSAAETEAHLLDAVRTIAGRL
ncbi:TetR/AcrR family transcriptional regulator [Oceanicella sp. SM1341]|uniref:TetR/AcrR family transcriptional regulator n=1 Tax=Oceanicella sp. SM1341 TaxID=1548889 RepID=UPI000E4BB156|nr:TetR/AcrR family transcriptional regulator [Oceanicella sp. SM1341]